MQLWKILYIREIYSLFQNYERFILEIFFSSSFISLRNRTFILLEIWKIQLDIYSAVFESLLLFFAPSIRIEKHIFPQYINFV